MKPVNEEEIFRLNETLSAASMPKGKSLTPPQLERIREVLLIHTDLRRSFIDVAECQLSARHRLKRRKTSPKSEILIADAVSQRIKKTCQEQDLPGNQSNGCVLLNELMKS